MFLKVNEILLRTKILFLSLFSAGLGRTGTFILVHSVIQKVFFDYNENPNEEPQVNLAHHLMDMRRDRPGMIQTEEQYLFCWFAIRDGVRQIIQDFELGKKTTTSEKRKSLTEANGEKRRSSTNERRKSFSESEN